MNKLIRINNCNNRITISGRDLHKYLEIKTKYIDWFNRMLEYGFIEDVDYRAITQKRETAQGNKIKYIDHQITIEMGKELGMIQRTPQGRKIRQYFKEDSEEC